MPFVTNKFTLPRALKTPSFKIPPSPSKRFGTPYAPQPSGSSTAFDTFDSGNYPRPFSPKSLEIQSWHKAGYSAQDIFEARKQNGHDKSLEEIETIIADTPSANSTFPPNPNSSDNLLFPQNQFLTSYRSSTLPRISFPEGGYQGPSEQGPQITYSPSNQTAPTQFPFSIQEWDNRSGQVDAHSQQNFSTGPVEPSTNPLTEVYSIETDGSGFSPLDQTMGLQTTYLTNNWRSQFSHGENTPNFSLSIASPLSPTSTIGNGIANLGIQSPASPQTPHTNVSVSGLSEELETQLKEIHGPYIQALAKECCTGSPMLNKTLTTLANKLLAPHGLVSNPIDDADIKTLEALGKYSINEANKIKDSSKRELELIKFKPLVKTLNLLLTLYEKNDQKEPKLKFLKISVQKFAQELESHLERSSNNEEQSLSKDDSAIIIAPKVQLTSEPKAAKPPRKKLKPEAERLRAAHFDDPTTDNKRTLRSSRLNEGMKKQKLN